MEATARLFPENVGRAVSDAKLQASPARFKQGFPVKRRAALDRLPEYEALRDAAVAVKDHVLANLDEYLERFEARLTAAGGKVHWAKDAEEARSIIVKIC